jgi:hypothetical protein
VGSELRSTSRPDVYPIRGGVPVFLRYPAEDTNELRDLNELLRFAERGSCLSALEQVYSADSEYLRYVTRRPAFLEFVPLAASDVVLEVGPGLGQFTPHIAKRVRYVHALDVVEQQARFTQARCGEAGLANVQADCGADDCRLPYADQSFDAVLMNLVFEWCASRNRDGSAPEAQARLLRETARVLKPGGLLYLTTKNRFALNIAWSYVRCPLADVRLFNTAAFVCSRSGSARTHLGTCVDVREIGCGMHDGLLVRRPSMPTDSVYTECVFEWDPRKAQVNADKHGVMFDDAVTVFLDANALDGPDLTHSANEARFRRLGRAVDGRLLMVAYTLGRRGDAETIRLISARRASRRERAAYYAEG